VKFSFLPAEVKFYDYFEKASANLLEGAQLLQKLFDDFDVNELSEIVSRITEIEKQGDFIVHEITNLLPRVLITPNDPIDIHHPYDHRGNCWCWDGTGSTFSALGGSWKYCMGMASDNTRGRDHSCDDLLFDYIR